MEASFWHKKWANNEIGFHRREANPLLVRGFPELALVAGSRVFVPLCGKTLDIPWLLAQGCRVAGAELSETAVEQLFAELEVEPRISHVGKLKLYAAEGIDIFAGDIFALHRETLGPVDAIYDRGALVALPGHMRSQYTTHLITITDAAPQLIICFEYDQSLMEGPPFSISAEEIETHYADRYDLALQESIAVIGGALDGESAKENVWILRRP